MKITLPTSANPRFMSTAERPLTVREQFKAMGDYFYNELVYGDFQPPKEPPQVTFALRQEELTTFLNSPSGLSTDQGQNLTFGQTLSEVARIFKELTAWDRAERSLFAVYNTRTRLENSLNGDTDAAFAKLKEAGLIHYRKRKRGYSCEESGIIFPTPLGTVTMKELGLTPPPYKVPPKSLSQRFWEWVGI